MKKRILSICLIAILLVYSTGVVLATEDITSATESTPTAEPTQEVIATATPEPTVTPEPVITDAPTDTPLPTEPSDATPTTEATQEPVPTSGTTEEATPTVTGEADTPTPVLTKKPTVSPTATSTPSPTSTPYATVVPPKEEQSYPKPNSTSDKSVVVKSPAVVKVDGIYDELWDSIDSERIFNISWGNAGATGTFKTYWDKNALYILVDVHDNTPDVVSEMFSRQDCVEIFLNENGTKPSVYSEGDCHFKVNREGVVEYGYGATEDNVDFAVIKTDYGYMVEASVKFLTVTPVFGHSIGFDVRVNDSQGQQYRDFMTQWSDTSMYTFQDLSKIGTLYLK